MARNMKELMEEIDVSTAEAAAYVKYFDFKRLNSMVRNWEHFTIRAFILSISYLGGGYYSVLRKVKDEVLFRDISELDGFEWLKGWIFHRTNEGAWWIIVDGEKDDFEVYKEKYRELRRQ